ERAALDGHGFLFRDLAYASYQSTPATDPVLPPEPATATSGTTIEATVSGQQVPFEASGFDPYENVGVSVYSTPHFAGWFRANAGGVVSGTITLPASFAPGSSHTLQAIGATSNSVAIAAITLANADPAELPATGAQVNA